MNILNSNSGGGGTGGQANDRIAKRCTQQLLVNGFIRNNCLLNVPIVLMELIFLFFNEILYLIINQEQLNILTSTENKQNGIYSKTVSINGVIFEYYLHFRHFLKCMLITFGVKMKQIPSNVRWVIMMDKIYDKQNKEYSQYCMRWYQDDIYREKEYFVVQRLGLKEIKNYPKQLEFRCEKKLLRIAYNDGKMVNPHQIYINEKCEYKYVIKCVPELFPTHQTVQSPSFDHHHNWILKLKGGRTYPGFCFRPSIAICQLPAGISEIKFTKTLTIFINDRQTQKIVDREASYAQYGHDGWVTGGQAILIRLRRKHDKITIKINLEIQEIFDCNDGREPIQKNLWNQYNVLCSDE